MDALFFDADDLFAFTLMLLELMVYDVASSGTGVSSRFDGREDLLLIGLNRVVQNAE
jgi:hypothetical protein